MSPTAAETTRRSAPATPRSRPLLPIHVAQLGPDPQKHVRRLLTFHERRHAASEGDGGDLFRLNRALADRLVGKGHLRPHGADAALEKSQLPPGSGAPPYLLD
jgi:hypothetical protein